MFLLLSQTADGAGGPFSTTPATVRGNMINITTKKSIRLDTWDYQKQILKYIL